MFQQVGIGLYTFQKEYIECAFLILVVVEGVIICQKRAAIFPRRMENEDCTDFHKSI